MMKVASVLHVSSTPTDKCGCMKCSCDEDDSRKVNHSLFEIGSEHENKGQHINCIPIFVMVTAAAPHTYKPSPPA